MKPIELNKQQIEAILNGASMLVMPIREERQNACKKIQEGYYVDVKPESIIHTDSSLQIGEEYYVIEEFHTCLDTVCIKNRDYREGEINKVELWTEASQMQPHQSRIKFKVQDTQAKRVQEAYEQMASEYAERGQIDYEERHFEDWYNDQYPNQPYEDNPYVFLPKLERI